MVKDRVNDKTDGKKVIEILIENQNIWIPAMATDLRILNNNGELLRVKEIRVRTFTKNI